MLMQWLRKQDVVTLVLNVPKYETNCYLNVVEQGRQIQGFCSKENLQVGWNHLVLKLTTHVSLGLVCTHVETAVCAKLSTSYFLAYQLLAKDSLNIPGITFFSNLHYTQPVYLKSVTRRVIVTRSKTKDLFSIDFLRGGLFALESALWLILFFFCCCTVRQTKKLKLK